MLMADTKASSPSVVMKVLFEETCKINFYEYNTKIMNINNSIVYTKEGNHSAIFLKNA